MADAPPCVPQRLTFSGLTAFFIATATLDGLTCLHPFGKTDTGKLQKLLKDQPGIDDRIRHMP
jgi:hypothetical protein